MAKKTTKRGALRLYKSYSFVDKDPILDAIKTAKSEAQMTNDQIKEASNVTVSTLRAWDFGATKRPQFTTASAVIRALGKKGIRYGAGGKPYLVD